MKTKNNNFSSSVIYNKQTILLNLQKKPLKSKQFISQSMKIIIYLTYEYWICSDHLQNDNQATSWQFQLCMTMNVLLWHGLHCSHTTNREHHKRYTWIKFTQFVYRRDGIEKWGNYATRAFYSIDESSIYISFFSFFFSFFFFKP